jgi:hypothetical protein
MFGDGFEQSTILRTGPDGLTRVVTHSSCDRRESVLVEAYEAELIVLRLWEEFHRKALGFVLVGRRMPARQEFGAPARQGSCVQAGTMGRLHGDDSGVGASGSRSVSGD